MESRIKKLLLSIGIFLGVVGGVACLSYNKTTFDEVVTAIPYQTITEYDDTQREGTRTVKQAGADGQKTMARRTKQNKTERTWQYGIYSQTRRKQLPDRGIPRV